MGIPPFRELQKTKEIGVGFMKGALLGRPRCFLMLINPLRPPCREAEVWQLRRLMKEALSFFRASVLLAILFLVSDANALSSGRVTANEIIGKAVARTKNQPCEREAYSFTKTTVREERDSQGQIKERKEESDQVIFKNGTYFTRDAKSGAQAVKKTDNELGGDDKSDKRKDYLDLLTPELVGKYIFSLVTQTNANGRSVYEIAFRPRAGNPPGADLKERVMNHATGTLWIDDSEFELVRARIHVDSEIPVGGFLGALKKAAFSLERMRHESGVWFESFYKTDYEARKLAQVKRITTRSECENFRPLKNG